MKGLARIIGDDGGLSEVVERARRLAVVDASVLIYGETGVGKEVFARAIHEGSPRQKGPFVALNCGGLSRELLASELFGYVDGAFTGAKRSGMIGKLEAADGGTLFLDEIAELPLDLQPYLLRVLEGGEVCPLGSNRPRQVRFRLISACNRQLREEVAAGRFRMDLFYRISVTSLCIPALRDRPEDIPALVEHFAAAVTERHGMAPRPWSGDVLRALAAHAWPGNVRQLRNLVEAIVLLATGDVIDLGSLPADLMQEIASCPNGVCRNEVWRDDVSRDEGTRDEAPLSRVRPAQGVTLGAAEKDAIGAAIITRQGNLTLAARDLCISRSTLYLKVKKHALDPLLDQARLVGQALG